MASKQSLMNISVKLQVQYIIVIVLKVVKIALLTIHSFVFITIWDLLCGCCQYLKDHF